MKNQLNQKIIWRTNRMVKQVNKWVKVKKIKDLVVVDINLDFHPLTPRNRWTENMVRELLLENDYNPGKCIQTSKVLNNRAIGENSRFLKGTFKFVDKDYVPPKQPAKTKPKTRTREQTNTAVSQKTKEQ